MSDKTKFEIEFVIQSSPQMLYQYLATPSGLSEWFADDVNSRGEMFSFIWDGSEEEAKMLKRKNDEFIKFAWEESEDDSYFETEFEAEIELESIDNLKGKLLKTLQLLPDGYRAVFNLYVLENLTHQEIAEL